MNPLSKTPFLLLLIPLVLGILLQYYCNAIDWEIYFLIIGAFSMLLSHFIRPQKQYDLRWIFGLGVNLFFVGIGIYTTSLSQKQSEFSFDNQIKTYGVEIINTPREKNKTTAYEAKLIDSGKKVLLYFQRDSLNTNRLSPGDEELIQAKIQPFQNFDMGASKPFDYVSYMHNKGFVGSAYIASNNWRATGNNNFSLTTIALNCRSKLLEFYKSLGFSDEEYAILSGLTVGYQDEISDEVKQGFRTTGTVHVLSVSGLHVGIIYAMIIFLLGFIRRNSKLYFAKPLLAIILLWIYAFVTGLEIPVVRAGLMLSVFCIGEIFGRKSYSLHNLYIAAFLILLINPLSFFDVGFQLSFSATFAILALYPPVFKSIKIKNKYWRKVWGLFSLSLVAQLGTFPLCLYYFGTFPTYFFIGNMVIVPLVTLITYVTAGVFVAKLFSFISHTVSEFLLNLLVVIVKFLVRAMTEIIMFIEKIPFAQLTDIHIGIGELLLLISTIMSITIFVLTKKTKALIMAMASAFFLTLSNLYENLKYYWI